MALLTVRDVAAHLKLSPWTVRGYLREGQIKSTRVGRRFRVDPRDLAAFIARAGEAL